MKTFLMDRVGALSEVKEGISLYRSKLTCEACILHMVILLVVQETYALQKNCCSAVFHLACKDHDPFLVMYNHCKLTPGNICR